jgi:hypothetical protein
VHLPNLQAHPTVELEQYQAIAQGRSCGSGTIRLRRGRRGPSAKTDGACGDASSSGYLEKSTSAGAWLLHRFPALRKSKEFEIFLAPTAPKYLSGTFISIDLWGICDGRPPAAEAALPYGRPPGADADRSQRRLSVTNHTLAAPLDVPLNNQREKPAYEHILPR